MSKNKSAITIVSLLMLTVFFSWGLWNTYFQQDEWNGFGLVIQLHGEPLWRWFMLITSQHAVPFTLLFWDLLYRVFGFHAEYFAISALVLHGIATYLVHMLVRTISGNKSVAYLTGFLFATNSRAAQAFTHFAVFPGTITSFILILAFIFSLTRCVQNQKLGTKQAILLLALFYSAVFFREDGLILPALLPIFMGIYKSSLFQWKNRQFFLTFYGGVGLYLLYRFSQQLTNTLAISITGHGFIKTFLYNAFSLPFKLIIQNLIEGIHLYNLFWQYKQVIYPESFGQMTVGLMYTIGFDFVVLILFTILLMLFFVTTRRVKEASFWRFTLFSLSWIIVSSTLLAMIGRPLNVVESRYLYLTSFPVLGIFSYLSVTLFFINSRSLVVNIFKRVGIAVLIACLIWGSFLDVRRSIQHGIYQANARKNILKTLTHLYPSVPDEAIFFVRCISSCTKNLDIAGVPNDLILPFTSGPGWIFMLQYAKNDEASFAQFFTYENGKQFLWDYAAEGYKKIGSRGFGYFISKPLLVDALRENQLSPDIVIGLGYDDRDFSLHDISGSVREEIRSDLATMSAAMK